MRARVVSRVLVAGVVLFGLGLGSSEAQTATPNAVLAWDQPAPSLADAQGYSYRYYPDGVTTGSALPATCAATADPAIFVCRAAFPAFTPADHSLIVTASNEAGESLPSAALAFRFVVLPATPLRVRIERP